VSVGQSERSDKQGRPFHLDRGCRKPLAGGSKRSRTRITSRASHIAPVGVRKHDRAATSPLPPVGLAASRGTASHTRVNWYFQEYFGLADPSPRREPTPGGISGGQRKAWTCLLASPADGLRRPGPACGRYRNLDADRTVPLASVGPGRYGQVGKCQIRDLCRLEKPVSVPSVPPQVLRATRNMRRGYAGGC